MEDHTGKENNISFSNIIISNSLLQDEHCDQKEKPIITIQDTSTPSFLGTKINNTVFSKNSSQDGKYSICTTNIHNIKCEMKHNLLFTIKDKEQTDSKKVFWMNDTVILDQEVNSNPKYLIYDNSDSDLLWKDRLMITAAGLDSGLRHVRDGYTFFGVNESYDNCIINDYLVNLPSEYRDKCNKRLFVVFFDRETSKFYFRSLKESNICVYVRIKKNYLLKNKKYFQIGDTIFHAEPHNESSLKITIHKNPSQYEEYYYNCYMKEILLGRSERCHITLNQDILSKIHCSFKFDCEKKKWFISDGNGEKASTNGTWMFCNSKYELNDSETEVKIGKSVLIIKRL